jgi:hypothetical protein
LAISAWKVPADTPSRTFREPTLAAMGRAPLDNRGYSTYHNGEKGNEIEQKETEDSMPAPLRSFDPDNDRPSRSRRRRRFRCPFCDSTAPPEDVSEVSTAGWILFALFAASLVLLPLCWVPPVAFRRRFRVCSDCDTQLGGS